MSRPRLTWSGPFLFCTSNASSSVSELRSPVAWIWVFPAPLIGWAALPSLWTRRHPGRRGVFPIRKALWGRCGCPSYGVLTVWVAIQLLPRITHLSMRTMREISSLCHVAESRPIGARSPGRGEEEEFLTEFSAAAFGSGVPKNGNLYEDFAWKPGWRTTIRYTFLQGRRMQLSFLLTSLQGWLNRVRFWCAPPYDIYM
jgi:hypothetical protein